MSCEYTDMKPKINFLRLILFALVAIVLFGGIFAVFYLMFRQRDASLSYERLSIDADMDYDVSGGYLTYASSTDLVQVNRRLWRVLHYDGGVCRIQPPA